MHTSPLAQPGTGDAGGMNVYVLQTALELAERGVDVEIFTRATSSADQPVVRVAPGVLVRNVVAGPFEGLDKNDLPTQLCAFTAGVLRAEATHEPGYYDIVHSHYWLSGQVGWLAADRWAVPLVHTAHTLAAVKNASLADGDAPEPPMRSVGEQQVADAADRLIVNTEHEARQLVVAAPCRSGAHRRRAPRRGPADVHPRRPCGRPRGAGPGSPGADRGVRGTDPAAEGAGCAAAGRGETAGRPRADRRRPVRVRARHARRPGSPRRRVGYQRSRDVPPAAVPRRPGARLPRRRHRRGAELLGILRPGRRRSAGLRDARGGRRRRWAARGGARRDQRCAGRRPRRRRLGRHHRRRARRGRRRHGRAPPPSTPRRSRGDTPWTRCWPATAARSPSTGAGTSASSPRGAGAGSRCAGGCAHDRAAR